MLGAGRLGPRTQACAARHGGFIAVAVIALILRAATSIAYDPAVFFPDSVGYIEGAFIGDPVGLGPARPSGYSLAIRILSELGGSLAAVTVLHHVAGLVTGALLYALIVHLGGGSLLATGAAAVGMLDAYAIALEQHVMAESFFTVLVVVGLALVAFTPRSVIAVGASGILLAVAATMRPTALFATPVWLGYLLWRRVGWRPALAGVAGLLAPLLLYGALHAAATSTFGLTQSNGWFLYGRVGVLADCRLLQPRAHERRLCNSRPDDFGQRPPYYIFNDHSPARRAFGWRGDERRLSHVDSVVGRFAARVIRERPVAYARLVTTDFLRFFQPGLASFSGDDKTVTLPSPALTPKVQPKRRDTVLGRPVERPRWPERLLRRYAALIHTPRWLMAFLAITSTAALFAGLVSRGRYVPRRREIFLLAGSALAMLLGSAATSDFTLRYLVPAVPLLVAGGAIAARELRLVDRPPGRSTRASAPDLRHGLAGAAAGRD